MRERRWRQVSLLLGLAFSLACASTNGPPDPDADPWEPMNRKIFGFNEGLDRWVIEPASKGWDFAVPDGVQASIKNFFDNIFMPAVFVNHLFQFRFKEAFTADLPRFLMNTTVGWAGLFDAASTVDIDKNYTDFGITLGRWGVPTGPYLVLPLLGSSSPRNAVGKAADAWSTPYSLWVAPWVSVAVRAVELVNLRTLYSGEIDQSRNESIDYYSFVRSAWVQNRRFRVLEARGEEPSPEFDDAQVDLYYIDAVIDLDADEGVEETDPPFEPDAATDDEKPGESETDSPN